MVFRQAPDLLSGQLSGPSLMMMGAVDSFQSSLTIASSVILDA